MLFHIQRLNYIFRGEQVCNDSDDTSNGIMAHAVDLLRRHSGSIFAEGATLRSR